MTLYEISKTRPINLEKLYTDLKTIKPSSVKAEDAFYALRYFVSKIEIVLTMTQLMLCRFSAITIVNKLCLFTVQSFVFFASSIQTRDYVMEISGKSRARDF